MGVFACLVALCITLFYAEEDWRGARAFADVRSTLAAQGESLDWHRSVPPPIPNEQNLAMAPLFVRELNYGVDPKTHVYTFGPPDQRPKDLEWMPYDGTRPAYLKGASFELARRTDLTGYQKFYRQKKGFTHPEQPGDAAADVLLALTRYGPALDELSQATRERPLTRFPVDWGSENRLTIALPHYNLEQQLVATLGLRASAQLAAGRVDAAARDLEVCLRLCRDMGADHLIISHLVEIVCLNVVLNRVWEGLTDKRWTATELVRFEEELRAFDLLEGYADAIRRERADSVLSVNYLERRRDMNLLHTMVSWDTSKKKFPFITNVGLRLLPRGWFDLANALDCRFVQKHYIEAMDVKRHRYLTGPAEEGSRTLAAMPLSPQTIWAKLSFPVWKSIGARTARAQVSLDQAVTACALERFFLDHHAYPARLDELVSGDVDHVPTDVIDGAPLRYRPTSDGRYQLYGVGWNGRDDGGRVAWESAQRLNDHEGDWVWQYSALQRPPPPGK